ncbi:Hypoxia up-regulated protein 1 [Escovopsis weberi]|uniref:Hypoxia up-regulated protein 1 n=1 Tax=Escovopsis weberi TaxID=150374 RepID=A0A0M8MZ89_ESCWE|nr:Hypoxia up-regulated protein 1 [Escovopsis weberi]
MTSPRTSPVLMLIGAVFLLASHVLAASAVIGVDLGTEYIKAVLVKPGVPFDIVLTKDSRRKETSAIAFKPFKGARREGQFPERSYGADAMAIAARFPDEVYPNLKAVLGLHISDPSVTQYSARHPALRVEVCPNRETVAFRSSSVPVGDDDAWMVEELLAMEFQSIRKNAQAAAGDDSRIRSAVLTVPPFYTTAERRAIQTAAELAGLKVLSVISDGLAVGVNYATSRQFPNINEGARPEHHMVFDMGAGSTTATVMKFYSRSVKDVGKFNKTVQEIQVLGSGWDRTLGGDEFNCLIVDDMISQFVKSKGARKISATAEGVKAHGRAVAKLAKEAERLRHVLSANQNTQASFEGLYEDADFKYKITRVEFEAMAEAHAERLNAVIRDALAASGLKVGDLASVILHGGATRTPFVQKALEKIVGSADKIRSNVNSDEAAAFGATFRAAELSPSFRVKEIRTSEGANYPAGLMWEDGEGEMQHQELWTAASVQGGAAAEVIFSDLRDFTGTFYQQIGDHRSGVKTFSTKNLTATAAALQEKYPSCVGVQFKAGVKLRSENGEVEFVSAAVECEAEVPEKETLMDGVKNLFGFGKKDQQPIKSEDGSATSEPEGSEEAKNDNRSSESANSATTSSAEPEATEEVAKEVKKKAVVSIPVEISTEKIGYQDLSKAEWTKAKNRLKAFAASDKDRLQREEALNQLEAYTYRVRDQVDSEAVIAKSTDEEREALTLKANEFSDWLYEDSEEATKEDFQAKLKILEDILEPILARIKEAEGRPALISRLNTAIQEAEHLLSAARRQAADYEQQLADFEAQATSPEPETPSPEAAGEFDGLEEEGSQETMKEKKKAAAAAEKKKKAGPPKPAHSKQDMDDLEALHTSTYEWLAELLAKQDALAETADPVLLTRDLVAKNEALTRANTKFIMKIIEKQPKVATGKGKGKTKEGQMTEEDGEELLAIMKEWAERSKKEEEKPATAAPGTPKPEHDEL